MRVAVVAVRLFIYRDCLCVTLTAKLLYTVRVGACSLTHHRLPLYYYAIVAVIWCCRFGPSLYHYAIVAVKWRCLCGRSNKINNKNYSYDNFVQESAGATPRGGGSTPRGGGSSPRPPRHTETQLILPGHVLFVRPASVKR